MPMLIWAPNAPTELVRPYKDEPEYKELRSALPQLNISSPVGAQLLQILGVPVSTSGTLSVDQLRALLPRLTELRDNPQERASAVSNTGVLVERQLLQYVLVLHDLFTQASSQNYSVSWG